MSGVRESMDRLDSLLCRDPPYGIPFGSIGVRRVDDGTGDLSLRSLPFEIADELSFAAMASSLAATWAAGSACRFFCASPTRRIVFKPSLSISI